MARVLDMRPALSGPDLTDCRRVHPQSPGPGCVGVKACPQLQNVGFGDLGVPVPFSSCMTVPLNTLLYVLLLGPQAQVVGMNTDGAVARVKHVQPVGDWTVVDSVGDNMSSVLSSAEGDYPVPSALEGASSPVPAPFSGRGSGHVVLEGFSLREPPRLPGRPSCQRVAVTREPCRMRGAVSPSSDRLLAELNRADSHDRSVTHNEN